jgi:aromatic-L-amino-acid decarboxylase
MTPEEFRRQGRAVVDWIADYWAALAGGSAPPVQSPDPPGSVAERLPAAAPATGEDFGAILADLDTVVLPGMTHWQHPGFFAYFPANTSGPSVLGDLVSAGLGVQGMLWSTGPACTEVEIAMMDWLVGLLGLPERFSSAGRGGGVIQDSASSATLVATLAALHRASGGAWRSRGVTGGGPFHVYTSTQGHSSIEKAARIAGLGDGGVRLIDVDDATLAMRPDALRAALAADRAAGATPALVVATVGTTSTAAVDPLPAVGELCREYGAWLHVDGAYAGAAAVCPEFRGMHAGLELADSYCFDPHKWLLTGFDCDAFWVADRAELVDALTVLPEFLRNAATESGEVIDYRDWQVPLGRRFRALKLWFTLRWYGAEGLRAHVRDSVALAGEFADLVRGDDRFEIVAPPALSLVCFRLRDADDAANAELLRRVNATGDCFLTHTSVRGRHALRFAVGSPYTRSDHVARAWRRLGDAATAVLA